MKLQAVPFPIHSPYQLISITHHPGCVPAPLTVFTVEVQCNQSRILQLLPFSSLIFSTGPRIVIVKCVNINQNTTGEKSFPCNASVLLVPSYLQSTFFLFSNKIVCCLTADYITFLNSQQHLTSPRAVPKRKQLWRRCERQQPQ